ncbi:hypothetical protein RRG08_052957 [Elysia crispata]|uniref:Uncharacterized protein n=1 Tax=Elysia crispata TaxID=231223 RepID=A0AAE0ZK58_9GAST|nr:hypothetical protein RRG08_052957 [Elysia crispata]
MLTTKTVYIDAKRNKVKKATRPTDDSRPESQTNLYDYEIHPERLVPTAQSIHVSLRAKIPNQFMGFYDRIAADSRFNEVDNGIWPHKLQMVVKSRNICRKKDLSG